MADGNICRQFHLRHPFASNLCDILRAEHASTEVALVLKRRSSPIFCGVLQTEPKREQHAVADDDVEEGEENQEYHGELDRIHTALTARRRECTGGRPHDAAVW